MFLDLRFAPFLAKRCKTERKAKKISKALSITLAVLFGITLITVLCVMIIPELVYSLTTLAKSLPGELERVIDFLRNGIDTEVFWGETLKNFIDNAFNAFNNWITTGLPETRISSADRRKSCSLRSASRKRRIWSSIPRATATRFSAAF